MLVIGLTGGKWVMFSFCNDWRLRNNHNAEYYDLLQAIAQLLMGLVVFDTIVELTLLIKVINPGLEKYREISARKHKYTTEERADISSLVRN
jgi:hypothetical protein